LLGRTAGHGLILRYGKRIGITQKRIDEVHAWFARAGDWLLAFGYFIPGVRHFTALVAGMSQLEYPRFAAFAYGGAAVWVTVFLSLGYFVGEKWQATMRLVHRYTWISLGLSAIPALLVLYIRLLHSRRARRD
jgi:membrane protein DedA with SNARE-associated domain